MEGNSWISILIAAGALVVAVIALILGEVRARAMRRDAHDSNDVEWVVGRGFTDADVMLLNIGLDEARNVRVRIVHEQLQYVERFDRVTSTEPESVAVPSLEPLWRDYRRHGSDGDDVTIATVGVRISWESPRGKKDIAAFSAHVRSRG